MKGRSPQVTTSQKVTDNMARNTWYTWNMIESGIPDIVMIMVCCVHAMKLRVTAEKGSCCNAASYVVRRLNEATLVTITGHTN